MNVIEKMNKINDGLEPTPKTKEEQAKLLAEYNQAIKVVFQGLFDNANGEIVLGYLKTICDYDISHLRKSDNTNQIIYNEGRRSVILDILFLVNSGRI